MDTISVPEAVMCSVIEFSTPHLSFAEDLEVFARAGYTGIGLIEAKLTGDDVADLALLRESGLAVSSVMPHISTILPAAGLAGPPDPADRVAEIAKVMARTAVFEPACFTIAAGPYGEYAPDAARAIVVDGFRTLTAQAEGLGLKLAVELMHPSLATTFSFMTDIEEGVAILDEIGNPAAMLCLDTWHLSEDPNVVERLEKHASRVAAFHFNDRRVPTRTWADRVLPGDGDLPIGAMVAAVTRGGFDGWFELEVISDDGTIMDDLEDSLWKGDAFEFVRDGRTQFLDAIAGHGV